MHPPYQAIITVTIPGTPQPLEAHVLLLPQDHIETADGYLKPLPACTLADLRHYADKLEGDVWETQQAITLKTLASDNNAWVKVRVTTNQKTFDRKALAQTYLRLPHGRSGSPPPQPPNPQETGETELFIEELIVVHDPQQPNNHKEPTPPHAAKSSADDPLAPRILVAESEPIHEEREVAELAEPGFGAKAATADQKNRTAGEKKSRYDPIPNSCDILIDEIPFRGTQAHALTSLNREVAGVLVGPHPEKQPNGRYVVHITDYIIAKHTRMQGASVTYTPESWRYVNDVMMARYPDEECVIVGWYHTHPGFGIFLSNMDLFIHHNFFTQKWHIALVLDPVGKRSGFFSWDRAQKEVLAYPFPWPHWAHRSW